MDVCSVLFFMAFFTFENTFVNGYSYKLVSRREWGASPSTDTRALNTPVSYVVIHHTAIPGACYSSQRCAADMRSMQEYHQGLGWGDIGYNFCVGGDDAAYVGRGWDVVGIHAGSVNSISVGICLIGDWRTELPPASQLNITKALISTGVELGVISKDYKLIGHNQAMPTECPGTMLMKEIATWDHYSDEDRKSKNGDRKKS